MSVMSRRTELQMHKKWKDREISPERTKVWTEPSNHKLKSDRKVPVVYYISRNGQLEHPHFMEVPLSSPHGLYLRDVINRLNCLRGKGMASMYSWSAKRSYRNGFVWQDLTEHDFIYPAQGQEYILKGSQLLDSALHSQPDEIACSGLRNPVPEVRKISKDHEFPVIPRRRNQSWTSSDFHEYRVYKAESTDELIGRAASDASTQTDDRRRRRRAMRIVEEEEEELREDRTVEPDVDEKNQKRSIELNRGEISPPQSDSSSETLETLMRADGRVILRPDTISEDPTVNIQSSGKSSKASSMLKQLLSWGSMSFKCGPGYGKENRFSIISQHKSRLPRVRGSNQVEKDVESPMVEYHESEEIIQLEDKEYFSGSLIEIKKEKIPALKRSASYNVESCTKLELTDKKGEMKTNAF
ncbi:PREDICTED: protein UPSTREAM OF FLC-like [Nicotiana attenuata]|uniref:Protein upstream of flc n=1 Tax=Nicotiana attenuata TaxID=49451 RepID=A0A1J6IJY8_NICAT|nr:PREDICTED: protein UPSTREAM OF FLC-like [Nicotiana attenuata]OIT00840.1 protein upstream of flc [Nicotiana attenuata]